MNDENLDFKHFEQTIHDVHTYIDANLVVNGRIFGIYMSTNE